MYKEKLRSILLALALCLLLSACQMNEDIIEPQFPETYSDWFNPFEPAEKYQKTQYVIALDRSFSMDGAILERNDAAAALINSLPEDSEATAFFFNTDFDKISDMLPLSDEGRREQLITTINKNKTAAGGTDLGFMMKNALGLFTGQGEDSSIRHVLFVVTDGQSDGKGDEPARRDQEFFRLCQEKRDTVETYVVYVSSGPETPKSLCEGLKTTPITLPDAAETEAGTMDQARSRLSVWEEGEAAKIIHIPDTSRLEAALLNFRFAEADAIYNRQIDHSMTVSFPVFPLRAKEITVAFCGGADAGSAITSLKNEEGANLLESAAIDPTASILTLSKEDLEPGLYTMDINTSQPLSLVIACKYDYRVQYGFAGAEKAEEPPAGTPVTFHMRLGGPDGKPLENSGYVTLSARMQEEEEDLGALTSGQAASLPLAEAGLSLVPVISYGGIEETLPMTWEIRPTDLPPELSDHSFCLKSFSRNPGRLRLCEPNTVSTDRETPLKDLRFSVDSDGFTVENFEGEQLYLHMDDTMKLAPLSTQSLSAMVEDSAGRKTEAQWTLTIVWVTPFLLGLLVLFVLLVILLACHIFRKRLQKEEEETRKQKKRQEQEIKRKYQQDISPNDEFIRAGLSWSIWENQDFYVGGLGMTDDTGELRKGCRLSSLPSHTISDGKLMKKDWPEKVLLGAWKYSKERGCTELILKLNPGDIYRVDSEDLVSEADYEYEGGRLIRFGVNNKLPRRKVEVEVDGVKTVFRLEYYTDHEPFYQ